MKHNNQACCRNCAMGSKCFWKHIFVSLWRSSNLRPFFFITCPVIQWKFVDVWSQIISVCVLALQIVTVFFLNSLKVLLTAFILIDLVLTHFLFSIHHGLVCIMKFSEWKSRCMNMRMHLQQTFKFIGSYTKFSDSNYLIFLRKKFLQLRVKIHYIAETRELG